MTNIFWYLSGPLDRWTAGPLHRCRAATRLLPILLPILPYHSTIESLQGELGLSLHRTGDGSTENIGWVLFVLLCEWLEGLTRRCHQKDHWTAGRTIRLPDCQTARGCCTEYCGSLEVPQYPDTNHTM